MRCWYRNLYFSSKRIRLFMGFGALLNCFVIYRIYSSGSVMVSKKSHDNKGHGQKIRPIVASVIDTVKHSLHSGQYHVVGGSEAFRRLVFPSNEWDDRIEKQLEYRPSTPGPFNTSQPKSISEREDIKFIYMDGGLQGVKPGDEHFRADDCPIQACFLSADMGLRRSAHARLILDNGYVGKPKVKPPGQIWILWITESPLNTPNYTDLNGKVNWTVTYRADSTLASPYGFYVRNGSAHASKRHDQYKKHKTKKNVAWFVSNCHAGNQRLEYARRLSQYIDVDIIGSCGQQLCPRTEPVTCNRMLQEDYKFYLSFENSNCKHYISEKLFTNAMGNDVLPIVMGARQEDYRLVAPPGSFIHVEKFPNPQKLAEYLHTLARNQTLYDELFRWKEQYTFKETRFWCSLCAMLHDNRKSSVWYDDVEAWWRDSDTCTRDRWDDPNDKITNWSEIVMNHDLR